MLRHKVWNQAFLFQLSLQYLMTKALRSLRKHHLHLSCLKKAASLKSGSGRPNTEKVGTVNRAQLEDIATTKMPDLSANDMNAAVRTIAGTARSMGLDTEGVE